MFRNTLVERHFESIVEMMTRIYISFNFGKIGCL